jgi:hypothetical protein
MQAAVDRVVFSTESVTVGAFRCAVNHPSFRNSGPIRDDCFVFPRTTLVIQHDRARAFVADPTVISLYNRRQAYERRAISVDGDRCDWFAVSHDLLRAALVSRSSAASRASDSLLARAPMPRHTWNSAAFIDASRSAALIARRRGASRRPARCTDARVSRSARPLACTATALCQ